MEHADLRVARHRPAVGAAAGPPLQAERRQLFTSTSKSGLLCQATFDAARANAASVAAGAWVQRAW